MMGKMNKAITGLDETRRNISTRMDYDQEMFNVRDRKSDAKNNSNRFLKKSLPNAKSHCVAKIS